MCYTLCIVTFQNTIGNDTINVFGMYKMQIT